MTEEKVADVATESNGTEEKAGNGTEEKAGNGTEEKAGSGTEEKAENGAKTEPMDEAELESAIIRQIEYYFGDLNLPRDKFLREQVKLDDGWVPFDILIRFNRLSKLTTDLELIAKLLGRSRSGLLEISEDNKKVRRSPDMPLPEMNEERRKEVQSRTVYAKGFPKDEELDAVLAYFKQFEEVENVIMRKYQDGKTKKRLFKGSVFATFKTKEQAEKFLEQSEMKYGENELIRKWQEAYVAEKQEEYAARKEKKDKKPKAEQEAPQDDFKLPVGTVLHLAHSNDKLKREDIKEGFSKFAEYEIAYVDSNLGDTQGWVRFAKENAAKEVIEKITHGKLTFADTEVTVKLLEGDEETAYLTRTVEQIRKRRFNHKSHKHHNKGRNFKGGRQGGRKRRQDQHDDAPASKVKTE